MSTKVSIRANVLPDAGVRKPKVGWHDKKNSQGGKWSGR